MWVESASTGTREVTNRKANGIGDKIMMANEEIVEE